VLRITLGPKEKTPVHEHPAAVAIFLADGQAAVSLESGPTDEKPRKRGMLDRNAECIEYVRPN